MVQKLNLPQLEPSPAIGHGLRGHAVSPLLSLAMATALVAILHAGACPAQEGARDASGAPLSLSADSLAVPPALPAAPGPPAGPCADGVQAMQEERFAAAVPLLESCLSEGGEHLEPLILLTAAELQQKQTVSAESYGERAVKLAPDSPDALYWYGRALLAGGDEAGAVRNWQKGLQIDQKHLGLLEGMARLALDRHEDAKAYGLLRQLQAQGVDDAWIHRLLSDLARRKGMWSVALQHWRDFMARDGESEQSLLKAGELSILAGDTAAAVRVCRRAVEIGGSPAAYGALGEALFAAQRNSEAVDYLRRAVAGDPDEPRHHFNLANVLEVLGKPEEAEEQFARYVQLDPEDPLGRFNYGIHLDKLNQTQKALEQIEQAVALDRSWKAARVMQAQLLEKLGRQAEALATLDSLLALGPEQPDQIQEWRAKLQEIQQENEQASREGKVRLLHIVTADTAAVRQIEAGLAQGTDFAVLATRFSVGTTAAQGGDIGWVSPGDMVEPMRSCILALHPQDVSPPVESRGLVHFFKRIH